MTTRNGSLKRPRSLTNELSISVDNLTTSGSSLPADDNDLDLGSSAKRYRTIYAYSLSALAGTTNITGTVTINTTGDGTTNIGNSTNGLTVSDVGIVSTGPVSSGAGFYNNGAPNNFLKFFADQANVLTVNFTAPTTDVALTVPEFSGDDTLTFNAKAATLTNKTITNPNINGIAVTGIVIQGEIALTTLATEWTGSLEQTTTGGTHTLDYYKQGTDVILRFKNLSAAANATPATITNTVALPSGYRPPVNLELSMTVRTATSTFARGAVTINTTGTITIYADSNYSNFPDSGNIGFPAQELRFSNLAAG